MERRPEILCFTEHWLKPEEEQFTAIDNYVMKSCYSRKEIQHGGVCIFALDQVDCEEITDVRLMSIDGQLECACIKVKSNKSIILCMYRTGLGNTEVFLEILSQVLDFITLNFMSYKIVLCGDFNINLFDENHVSIAFLDILRGYNLEQMIFEPTRVTKKTSSLVDNIFTNIASIDDCRVLNLAISDHFAQILTYDCEVKQGVNEKSFWYKRVFSESKLRDFCFELQSESWNEVLECVEVDNAYNGFLVKLENLLERIFPVKRVKSKQQQKNWLTTGIRTSCQNKRMLYRDMLHGYISEMFYKKYSNLLKKIIKEAKAMSNKKTIENAKNKSKATWSIIKKITKNNLPKSKENIIKNIGENYASSSSTNTLNIVNDYFMNACPNIIQGTINYDHINSPRETFRFTLINSSIVKDCIKGMKNLRSTGEDGIPVSILKKAADIIALPLAHIINLCFCTGAFPSALKTAYVKPIYKKGSKNDLKNYRPVSLLSNLNKIFERIMYNQLLKFLEEQSVICENQNGFRKGKSTIRAIYQALTDVLWSLDEGQTTTALFIDLSKAFDMVDHGILCEKLKRYGIEGVSFRLLQSYLENRYQCVVEYGECGELLKSDKTKVIRGVPQGSILGPLLYILYVNEVPKVTSRDVILYADDTSVIFSENNKEGCIAGMCESLSLLEEWFYQNNLLMNVDKTQMLCFSQQIQQLQLTYGTRSISAAEHVSFLGVTLDHRLDWKNHIEQLSRNLSSYSYAVRVLSQSVGHETALTAYHAYMQSRISYGIIFWGNSVNVGRILIIQKRCLRGIFGLGPRESCRNVFRDNNILTVFGLYILEAIMFIKKNPDLFEKYLFKHSYNTRTKNNFKLVQTKFSYIQRNVEFSIIKIWNRLPEHFRTLPEKNLKNKLKGDLCSRVYYSLSEYFNDQSLI